MGTALRVLLAVLCLVLVLGGAFWVFGPREPVDLTIRFDPASIGDDPEAYLKRREADIPNLRPSAEKEIVWADPRSKAKTPIAFVYLHGFSAAKPETRPLLDIAAREIGANLFYTRLTGHGRDPAAMPQTSVKDWLNDLAEAIAIGRRIGERVVIVGTSTGATLATLGASVPGLMDGVAGLVFISPNYAVNDPLAFMLEVPMARTLLPRLGGAMRGFEPSNAAEAEGWTWRYPTEALAPLGALVRATRSLDPAKIALPLLVFRSDQDRVVNSESTTLFIARWGGPREIVTVNEGDDPNHHVLAGDVLSPSTTTRLAGRIAQWVKALP